MLLERHVISGKEQDLLSPKGLEGFVQEIFTLYESTCNFFERPLAHMIKTVHVLKLGNIIFIEYR